MYWESKGIFYPGVCNEEACLLMNSVLGTGELAGQFRPLLFLQRDSQHSRGILQPSLAPVPGHLIFFFFLVSLGARPVCGIHTYMQARQSYI